MATFASINATTGNKSETLSYTDEQGANIILSFSLFQEMLQPPEPSVVSLSRELEDLKKRDLRLLWHSITLSEYWRVKRIPRGLRLQKTPSFGLDDPDLHKWEQILNKCSLDLMLLIIQKTTSERDKTKRKCSRSRRASRRKLIQRPLTQSPKRSPPPSNPFKRSYRTTN